MSFDSVDKNRAFAEKYAFPYRLLSDTDRKIGFAYQATSPGETGGAKRISYLIDPKGNIARAYTVIDKAAHAAQVLADIDALA
jgi:peroxiredoxin Q/BCP